MKYLSLFTGIGGFELGIQQAYENLDNWGTASPSTLAVHGDKPDIDTSDGNGRRANATCIGYSEIDRYATQIYSKHFPEHKNYGDIKKINEAELPEFDLLVGGFPCQSFSIAGKRGGFNDTRGTLFFDIARILKAKQPRLLLLENVKGLLSHDEGRTFATIIATLDELGYDLQWQVLNSKNFGVPQNRERVFIVGHLRGTSRPKVFPITGESQDDIRITGKEVARSLDANYFKGVSPNGHQGSTRQLVECSARHETRTYETIAPTVQSSYGMDGRRFKENGEPSFTLTSQDKHGVAVYDDYNHRMRTDGNVGTVRPTFANESAGNGNKLIDGMKIRRLTPTECMRLQGFPDNWCDGISDSQKYKCCGNAVTVNVIQAIMERLLPTPLKK